MNSLMFGSIRSLVEGGGWVFLVLLFIGASANAIRDTLERVKKAKASGVKMKCSGRAKIVFDWALVLLTVLAALSSQLSSDTADGKIERQGKEIGNLSRGLIAAEAKLRPKPLIERFRALLD